MNADKNFRSQNFKIPKMVLEFDETPSMLDLE